MKISENDETSENKGKSMLLNYFGENINHRFLIAH